MGSENSEELKVVPPARQWKQLLGSRCWASSPKLPHNLGSRERGDSSPLPCSHETWPVELPLPWGPQYQRDVELLERVQRGPQRTSKGWSIELCVLGDSKAGEVSPGLLEAFAEDSTALLSLYFHPLMFVVSGSVLAQQNQRLLGVGGELDLCPLGEGERREPLPRRGAPGSSFSSGATKSLDFIFSRHQVSLYLDLLHPGWIFAGEYKTLGMTITGWLFGMINSAVLGTLNWGEHLIFSTNT